MEDDMRVRAKGVQVIQGEVRTLIQMEENGTLTPEKWHSHLLLLHQELEELPSQLEKGAYGLKRSAYDLWNLSVRQSTVAESGEDHLGPRTRHMAANMLVLAPMTTLPDLLAACKLFTRTGKAWRDQGKDGMALRCIETASSYWAQAESTHLSHHDEYPPTAKMCRYELLVEKGHLAWIAEDMDGALRIMKEAEEAANDDQTFHLAVDAFERACKTKAKGDLARAKAYALFSLSLLAHLPRGIHNHQRKASAFRLLSKCAMDEEKWEEAREYAGKACEEASGNPADLLSLEIVIREEGGSEVDINSLVRKIMCTDELDCILQAVTLLRANGRIALASETLDEQIAKHQKDSSKLVELLSTQLRLQLEEGEERRVMELTQSLFPHVPLLQVDQKRGIHDAVWNKGTKLYQQGDMMGAYTWILMTIPFCDEEALPQSHVVLARCLYCAKDYSGCLTHGKESYTLKSSSAAHLIAFLACVHLVDEEGALVEIDQMCNAPDFTPDYLNTAAMEAWSANNRKIVLKTLEKVLETASWKKSTDAGKVIRLLVKLTLYEDGKESEMEQLQQLALYLEMGLEKVSAMGGEIFEEPQAILYVISSAWKYGTVAASHHHAHLSTRLLCACVAYAKLLPDQSKYYGIQLVTHLLAAASHVDEVIFEREYARASLDEIGVCLDRANDLVTKMERYGGNLPEGISKGNVQSLLLSIGLLSQAYGGGDTEQLLKALLQHKSTDSVLVENVAAALSRSPKLRVSDKLDALEQCLQFVADAEDVDAASHLLRTMIELHGHKEGASALYDKAMSVIRSMPGVYPSLELQWLCAQSWNEGVSWFRLQKYKEAESFMVKAMNFAESGEAVADAAKEMMQRGMNELMSKKSVTA